MFSLIARLREDARGGMAYHELSDEAADEIEKLMREKADLWLRCLEAETALTAGQQTTAKGGET